MFGPADACVVSAPGRVSLIGEHIDYHGKTRQPELRDFPGGNAGMIASFSGYRRGMSSGRRGARTSVGQELLQHGLEFGYAGGRDVPDFVEIHSDVIVDQDVAHAADRLPIE